MTTVKRSGKLIAVEGVSHAAIAASARAALAGLPRRQRGGISWWDASGLFGDLAVADAAAGTASARTLLLLYAADLAFRLRWEIRPLLAKGRTVVAASYVDTATAFGRAAGVPEEWVSNLFQFAPQPDGVRRAAGRRPARRGRIGFIEFGCAQLAKTRPRTGPQRLVERVRNRFARL